MSQHHTGYHDDSQNLAASMTNSKVNYKKPAFVALAFLLVTTIILGGGGGRFPRSEILIQLSALPALFIGLRNIDYKILSRDEKFICFLLFAIFALIIIHIIPLPPFIWQSLPGREIMTDIAAAIGRDNQWYSLSIDPSMSIESGLSLIIFAAIILAGFQITTAQRIALFKLILILAAVHLLVALMQMASGGINFYFFPTSHKGLPVGIFANRNHMGTLMILAIMISIGLIRYNQMCEQKTSEKHKKPSNIMQKMLLSAAAALFALGVLITNSRTATALLFIGILVIIFLAIPKKYGRFAMPVTMMGAALIGLVTFLLFYTNRFAVFNTLIKRFEQDDDQRFEFWPNIWEAIQIYMPFGSGLGTFDLGFRANEKLEIVGSHFVNNAHNEYLEIAMEAGLLGLIIVALALLWLLRKIITFVRSRYILGAHDILGLYLSVGVGLIALHSLTDYPMRRFTILSICALMVSAICTSNKPAPEK